MSASDENVWQPTAMQNLVRYAQSGTYFVRFRVGGKLIWKSLKTATFSVAKQRLPGTLRDDRSKIESLTAFAEGTVGNAGDVYPQKARASIQLKPRSKDHRELMIDFIRRSWPSLFETDCELWLSRYQQRYSPSMAWLSSADGLVVSPAALVDSQVLLPKSNIARTSAARWPARQRHSFNSNQQHQQKFVFKMPTRPLNHSGNAYCMNS